MLQVNEGGCRGRGLNCLPPGAAGGAQAPCAQVPAAALFGVLASPQTTHQPKSTTETPNRPLGAVRASVRAPPRADLSPTAPPLPYQVPGRHEKPISGSGAAQQRCRERPPPAAAAAAGLPPRRLLTVIDPNQAPPAGPASPFPPHSAPHAAPCLAAQRAGLAAPCPKTGPHPRNLRYPARRCADAAYRLPCSRSQASPLLDSHTHLGPCGSSRRAGGGRLLGLLAGQGPPPPLCSPAARHSPPAGDNPFLAGRAQPGPGHPSPRLWCDPKCCDFKTLAPILLQDVLNQDLAILLVMAAGALSVVRNFIFKKARCLQNAAGGRGRARLPRRRRRGRRMAAGRPGCAVLRDQPGRKPPHAARASTLRARRRTCASSTSSSSASPCRSRSSWAW